MARLYNRGECDYGKLAGLHYSTLKEFAKSPKHYRHRLRNPKKRTAGMELGSHDHVMVLEPERFLLEYAVWPTEREEADEKTGEVKIVKCQRRGKRWDQFIADNPGKEIIRDVDYEQAKTFKDAVRADRLAMQYLGFGRAEVAVTWTDVDTGIDLVGRVDWLTEIGGRPYIVDLKGSHTVIPRQFCSQAYRLCYHNQAAMYVDGIEQATGKTPGFITVAVEFAEPHDVVVFELEEDTLDVGRDEYKAWLQRYRECEQSGEWPGIADGLLQTFRLPAYALPDDEASGEDIGLDFGGAAAE